MIGLEAGTNTFGYANQNSLVFIDLHGLKVNMVCVKAANAKFQRCMFVQKVLYGGNLIFCAFIPIRPAAMACDLAADQANNLAVQDCRRWLQEDLSECIECGD